jgi:hypothetical protein
MPPPAPNVPPTAVVDKGVTSAFRAPPSAAPVAADAAPNRRSGRGIVWLAVACTLVGGLGYMIFHRPHSVTVAQVASELPAATPIEPPAAPAASAPAAEVAPPPPAAVASNEPAAAASAAPAPAPVPAAANSAAGTDSAAPGEITVTVNSVPPKALFYHFGKQVGVAPFVVQLKPGERHAYEVGLPGHITRKLVLDGTKTELTVGLREAAGTFIRRSPAF